MTFFDDALEARADTITARAREIRFTRAAQMLLTGIFFLAGFLPAKILSKAWFAVVWVLCAVADGWTQGWTPRRPSS